MADHYKKEETRAIIDQLNIFLADLAIVYYKTHGFHWNVEGTNFYSLHLMFEKFYKKLWKSMDEVAERIRALGEKAPASYSQLLLNATITEHESAPLPQIMAKILRDDYLTLADKAHEIAVLATDHGDLNTADIMIKKSTSLEKAAWMLHSIVID